MTRSRLACIKHLALALVGLWIACSTGCLGPQGLSVSRKRYNDAIVRTNTEEALLNFVRLRYLEQPLNLPVSGITSQFELSAGGELTVGQDQGDPTELFKPNVRFADRPTVVFNPNVSTENSKLFYTPLLAAELDLLLGSFNAERTIRIFVSQINRLDNASRGDGPTPPTPPQYGDFHEVADLIALLQNQHAILFPLEEREEDVEDLPPVANLDPQDLVAFKKAGYGLRKLKGDKEVYQLTKSTVVPTVQFRDTPQSLPNVVRLKQLLRLDPRKNSFDIQTVPKEFSVAYHTQLAGLEDTVRFTPRSLLQATFFLSQGIEVPPEHIAKGLVQFTRNPDGSLFNWGMVLEDLIRVHSCKRRPKNVFAAVRYRGYWFYIDATDIASINTMLIFNSALRLVRLRGGDIQSGSPILTLPVGG